MTMKSKHSILRVVPPTVNMKFNAFNITSVSCDLKVYNISQKKQRVLVLPLQTKYFEMRGSMSGWILPGLPLQLSIILHANCSRPYNDWLSIKSEEEDNLVVEISAVPDHTNLLNIPQKIDFGTVHLGKKVTSKITLSPIPGEQLSFLFLFPRPNPDCQIYPMKGKLKNEALEVEISYTPTAYITLIIPVQLYLPSISATPYYFKIYAVTKPGILRDEIVLDTEISLPEVSKKRIDLNSKVKHPNKICQDTKIVNAQVKLPQLTIHDTNLMLLKKSEWIKNSDVLLGPLGRDTQEDLTRKHDIECIFLNQVEQLKKENVKALSHHRTKLIEANVTHEIMQGIINDRNSTWLELKDSMQSDYNFFSPNYIKQRTIRNLNKNLDLKFSNYESNEWFARFQPHKKFVEVIRRILNHNRLLKKLMILKMLTPEDIAKYELK